MLDHPNTVTQTRSFNYNNSGGNVTALLQSATNPENGTVSYTYNADNTLATKTDARSQQVSYTYDTFQRVTKITRPSGQSVVFYYDTNPFSSSYSQNALGRLAAVQYQAGSPHTFVEMYSYNTAGELTGKELQITWNCNWWYPSTSCSSAKVFTLNGTGTYDTEGRMTSQTWPQDQGGFDPSVTYGFDSMGRANTLTETYSGTQYDLVTGVTYNAANQPLNYGYESWTYNVLGQITSHQATACCGDFLNVQYGYNTGNNGKIAAWTNVLTGQEVEYTYDSLNRLIQAQTAANPNVTQWGQSFVYDGFDNLLQKNVTAGSAPSLSVTVDSGNHLITSGLTYDASGNPTQMDVTGYPYNYNAQPLTWDAESRLVQLGSNTLDGVQSYGYDPGNHRVWISNGATADDTFWFYGLDGHRIGIYYWDGTDTKLSLNTDAGVGPQIYFRGRLQQGYLAQDQVGSTGGGGSYPYGEAFTGSNMEAVGFATYIGDPTGLDYALNRHYNATWGRFLTPDPYTGSMNPRNPQSFNRYAYVMGDPMNRNDASGLDCDLSNSSLTIGDLDNCQNGGGWGNPCPSGMLPGDGGGGPCAPNNGPGLWAGIPGLPSSNNGSGGGTSGGDSTPPVPQCDIRLDKAGAGANGDPYKHLVLALSATEAGISQTAYLEGIPEPMNKNGNWAWQVLTGQSWLNKSLLDGTWYFARNGMTLSTVVDFAQLDSNSVLCADVVALIAAYGSYQDSTVVYDGLSGPNSNTFVHYMLNQAGMSVPWYISILLAFEAPGWATPMPPNP